MAIEVLNKEHYLEVATIYKEGINTQMATFETQVPSWEAFQKKFISKLQWVWIEDKTLLGWCALAPTSIRKVYAGVAEVSVYVASKAQGKGIGSKLLAHLIKASEAEGIWSLQASIFPQNKPSINLHKKMGFREIGYRERIAQLEGVWHDNILFEKRKP